MSLSRGIPNDTANLIGVSIEGIIYGFSVLMFGATVFALVHNRSMNEVRYGMLAVACLLFILSTAHIIVNIIRLQNAFVTFRDTFPGGAIGYFGDISDPTFVLVNGIMVVQTFVGDGVLIYRCYAVWQSYWIIVLPLLGWCSVVGVCISSQALDALSAGRGLKYFSIHYIVAGSGALWGCARATTYADDIFYKKTGQWVLAFYSSTFATNLLATGLLAYRIWSVHKRAADIRLLPNGLKRTARIVIDAGLLYSANLLATLVCFVRGLVGAYISVFMTAPLIAIVFDMIIIRVVVPDMYALGRKRDFSMTSLRHNTTPSQGPLEVHISHLTETVGGRDENHRPPKLMLNHDSEEA